MSSEKLKCTMCNNTGYKDYAGFCLDECECEIAKEIFNERDDNNS